MAARKPLPTLVGPAEWGVCVQPEGRELATCPPPAPPPKPGAPEPLAAPPAPLTARAAMAGAPTLALLLLGQLLAGTEAQVSTGRRRAGLAPADWGGGPGL